MSNLKLPDPEIECWDYGFSQNADERLWVARPMDDPTNVVTCNANNWWRHLVCADTEELLKADVVALIEESGADVDPTQIACEQLSLGDILHGWRMLRYNGRSICVTECADLSPTQPAAYPGGPIAPVRNGFLYVAITKATGEPYAVRHLGTRPLPVAAGSINGLINQLQEAGVDDGSIFDDYWLAAVNVLACAIEWPIIQWQGRPFPLYPVMQLNPNHNGDAEEELLSTT